MIRSQLMRLGGFSLQLSEDTPQSILDHLGYFGHLAFVPSEGVDVEAHGDQLLDLARFVGVLRTRELAADGTHQLAGSGMALWLGDEDDKGEVYETAKEFEEETFANTIRELLPSSVTEGTLHSVAGLYSGRHVWESPRKAITYVCQTFGAEWRVNGNGSLDAGEPSDLFVTEPRAMIVRKGAGRDFSLEALKGEVSTEEDVQDFTTRVVLLAEGEGEGIATGDADLALNPYLDLLGNPVKRTRLVSESETSTGNAAARAQLALNRFSGTRRSVTLEADEYDVEGSFEPGDTVYLYDPEAGFYDLTNAVDFRGETIYPTTIRAIALEAPVRRGFTVAFRAQSLPHRTSQWLDLTPYFIPEESTRAQVTVGSFPRTFTTKDEPVGDRPLRPEPDVDDGVAPAKVVLSTPFSSYNFEDAQGRTRSAIVVAWTQPLDGDGSTITDGSHYEVASRVNGETEWTTNFVGFDTTSFTLQPLDPGVSYDLRVRAVDVFGNRGPWSDTETMDAEADVTPPSTPAAPTAVAGNPLRIQVTHELGLSTGGTYNLERDLSHLEVHVGETETFTASAATKVGTMVATSGMMDLSIPAIGSFDAPGSERWVRVIAVDLSGNASDPSDSVAVTATLVGTAFIEDLAVTNAKIGSVSVGKLTAGTLAAGTIDLDSILRANGASGSLILSGDGLSLYDAPDGGGTRTVFLNAETGEATFSGELVGATGTLIGTFSSGTMSDLRLSILRESIGGGGWAGYLRWENSSLGLIGTIAVDTNTQEMYIWADSFIQVDTLLRANDIDVATRPWAVYSRNTALNVSNNSHTLIAYGNREDHKGTWNSPTTSTFTIPQTGLYRLSVTHFFSFTPSTTGYYQLTVTRNSSSVTASSIIWATSGEANGYTSAAGMMRGTSHMIPLNQGDVLRTFAYHNTGATRELHGKNSTSRQDVGLFSIERVA